MSRWLIPLFLFVCFIRSAHAQTENLPILRAEDILQADFAAAAQPSAGATYDNSLRLFYYFNPQQLAWESYPYPAELTAVQYDSIRPRLDGSFRFYTENNQADKWLFYPGQGLRRAELSLCGEIMPLPNEGRWYLSYHEESDTYAVCHDARNILSPALAVPESYGYCGGPDSIKANPESDWVFILLCDYDYYTGQGSGSELPAHLYLYHHQDGSLRHLLEFDPKPMGFEVHELEDGRVLLHFSEQLYSNEVFYRLDFAQADSLEFIGRSTWCLYALCLEREHLYTLSPEGDSQDWSSFEVRDCHLIEDECELIFAKELGETAYYRYFLAQLSELYIAVIGYHQDRGFKLFIYSRETGEEIFSMDNLRDVWRSPFSQRLIVLENSGAWNHVYLLDVLETEVRSERIASRLSTDYLLQNPSKRYLVYFDEELTVIDSVTKELFIISQPTERFFTFAWRGDSRLWFSLRAEDDNRFAWELDFP